MLDLVVAAGLPRPAVNAALAIGGRVLEIDFLWREQRVYVETDGCQHTEALQRRRDLDRDAALAVAGYRGVRRTWDDVTRRPSETVAIIRSLLELR
ncbi:DUF559 domain-containing protein [Thermoleophilia bacterium SCSIO 60948]|nr:DUF559 domain-containing protein [Thermoleophilia bacterium SCSIO 60948]